MPARHETHVVVPPAANVPTPHVAQEVAGLESVSAVPAGHVNLVQAPNDPDGVNCPAIQFAHGVDGSESSSDFPAEQLKFAHSPDDPDGVYVPAGHVMHGVVALLS